jgi:hypothetical protein
MNDFTSTNISGFARDLKQVPKFPPDAHINDFTSTNIFGFAKDLKQVPKFPPNAVAA